jgi:hypothetical protein
MNKPFKSDQANNDLWGNAAKSTNKVGILFRHPYLLYSPNRRFLEGTAHLTAKGKTLIFELIFSIPVFILVLCLFLFYFLKIELWVRVPLITGWIIIYASLSFWAFHKLKYERRLSTKGVLLLGQVKECILTNKRSDTDIFRTLYTFTTPNNRHLEGIEEVSLPSNKLPSAGTEVVVLYLNDTEYSVL